MRARWARLVLAPVLFAACSAPAPSSVAEADAGAQRSPLEVRRALRQESLVLAPVMPKRLPLPFGDTTSVGNFGPVLTPAAPALETPKPAAGGSKTFLLSSPISPMPDHSGRFVMRRREMGALFSSQGFALSLVGGTKDEPRGWGLHATLVGAREVQPVGEKQQQGYVNHYLGESSKWQTEVPAYGQLAWEEVYPGIDMVVEPGRAGFAYRFVLSPGARAEDIVMRWDSATSLRATDDGRGAEVETGGGKLVVAGLRAFTEDHGQHWEIPAHLVVHDREISVQVDGWDRGTLVIDPTVTWSSYVGGIGTDEGRGIAVDASGNVLLAGTIQSFDFARGGGFDTTLGGSRDAFVAKVSGSGALLWSSYLGGAGDDSGLGIAVDASGNAFVTGTTKSADFPNSGGFDTTLGGVLDAFVTKVSGSGALLWSSYLGGLGYEDGFGVAVDGSGSAFITGFTQSPDFPSAGGFDTTLGGGSDAFVTKVSGSGALLWSSYLGGGYSETGWGIAVDASGSAFVTGDTNSPDFPNSGGFDKTLNGADGFVTKVSGTGVLLWSSFLGGANGERCNGVAVDATGNAFVTGQTGSTDFPTAAGFDTVLGGKQDAFVTKVSGTGVLLWSSFLGGSGSVAANDDTGYGIAVDAAGNAFVAGSTLSPDFPSFGGFDATLGGTSDAFVTKVSSTGAQIWSSYLGGAANDIAYGIAVDSIGNAFVTGLTGSSDFPSTGGFDTTYAGPSAWDGFVTVLVPASVGLGAACTIPGGCISGICTDGVCCDKTCKGLCEACTASKKGGGVDGVCGAIVDGLDPEGECTAGVCLGASTLTKAWVCNGSGACRNDGTTSCGAFACNSGACLSSCAIDSDCAAGHYCASGACVVKRALGAACSAATECVSGLCADSVCCDKACGAACEACTAKKKGSGMDGTCGPVAADTDPRDACAVGAGACAADGMCDGAGNCRGFAKAGTACGATTCAAGMVSGRVCKGDSAECIDDTRACAPYGCGATSCRSSCTTDADCDAKAWCSGGACLPRSDNGAACSDARACLSGFCADGVCCNAKCDGACEVCDDAPTKGTCTPVAGAPRGGRAACLGAGTPCAGACDGKNGGTCTYPAGKECGAACAENFESVSLCDDRGACLAGTPKGCNGFVCEGKTRCRTACASTADCAEAFSCVSNKCEPNGAKCSDDGLSVIDAKGQESRCGGGTTRCKGGKCVEICSTSDDCAPKYLCNAGACVAPAAETDDGGGCSYGPPSGDRSAGLASAFGALVFLGLARRRGRRRSA